jgi:hypothetical protein
MDAGPSNPKPKVKTDGTVDGRDAPWVEKYRPKTLDDVAAHKEIIDTSGSAQTALVCARYSMRENPTILTGDVVQSNG